MGSERRGRAVHGRLEVNPSGEEPTDRPRQKNAGLWEPYDGRLSRTVLREREGEVPSRHSPCVLKGSDDDDVEDRRHDPCCASDGGRSSGVGDARITNPEVRGLTAEGFGTDFARSWNVFRAESAKAQVRGGAGPPGLPLVVAG